MCQTLGCALWGHNNEEVIAIALMKLMEGKGTLKKQLAVYSVNIVREALK